MRYTTILTILIAGLMVIGMSGCAGATPAPAVTEPVFSTATVAPATTSTDTAAAPTSAANVPGAGTGLCSNPLFPVVQGATWTYSVTGAPSGPFTYTDTISNVRGDGFTLTTQAGDITRTQEWSCINAGLLALTLGGANAGTITVDGVSAEFTTSNSTGVTLPAAITPGMQWTNSLNIQGTFSIPSGQSAQGSGPVTVSMQEMGTESVTVPAGTFNATKVHATTTFDITVNYQGLNVPVQLTGNSDLWYAPGVGLIKSIESGSIAGQTFSATTELQSFNIP